MSADTSATPIINFLSTALSLAIDMVPIDVLHAFGRQAHIGTAAQQAALMNSIRTFGFVVPIVTDDQYGVLAGMARIRAAKALGITHVPRIRVSHLTPAKMRAFVLADNKIAQMSGWDRTILAFEFKELSELDIDFDLDVTGFDKIEIEDLRMRCEEVTADEMPAVPHVAKTRLGQIWQLGDQRLTCGDATKPETYTALMQDERAHAAFLDPPYNVPIVGHVTSQAHHREFGMGVGEMSRPEFTGFLARSFTNVRSHLLDGGIAFVCMDWRHIPEVIDAHEEAGFSLLNLCVWTKPQAGQGSFYRSQHELVFVLKSGDAPHRNRIQLGKFGRSRSNVWSYPSVNGFNRAAMADHNKHPTPKSVLMVRDALLDCTDKGDVVLDNFGGGGATLIAAEMIGRRSRLVELDPIYCDVIIQRWEAFTGRQAILLETGQTYREVAANPPTAAATIAPPTRIRVRAVTVK